MCNANDIMMTKVQDYLDHKEMIQTLTDEMNALADDIKAYLAENESTEMQAGSNIVQLTTVVSKRVDTPALKKLLGDALDPYFKVVTSQRFIVK